jgi:hypothetical protein
MIIRHRILRNKPGIFTGGRLAVGKYNSYLRGLFLGGR